MMNSIPITILTGFLGSGKTTLLNHLIKSMPEKKFAVIENEFGQIPIDNELVITAEEDLFILENGCICCS
ncbi:MAG: GTP-binding protein, partial [Flammeovirgaceae bacterium]